MEINFFNYKMRNSDERKKLIHDDTLISKSKNNYIEFGYDYFDNKNNPLGYGGYEYDGRFETIAKDIVEHYKLKKGMRILEIGCAKGFLLVEFKKMGMKVDGLDISAYVIENSHSLVRNDLQRHNVIDGLPFENDTFDFIISKEVLPHIPKDKIDFLLNEIIRCSKDKRSIFFEIQTGRTEKELEYMKKWDSTHKIMWSPEMWNDFFKKKRYLGDYHYKVLIEE